MLDLPKEVHSEPMRTGVFEMNSLRCWIWAVLPMVLLCRSTVSAGDRKPNVVLILADDLGWADTSLYGQTRFHETPNLDRLAKRGMTFTRAYSASPLCSPTRSAILTGLSPARTGITVPNGHVTEVVLEATAGNKAASNQKVIAPNAVTRLKTQYRTLAESLKDAGYVTGHFGKWHLGAEPYSPLQHGFDVDLPHHPGPGPAGSYVAPWKFRNFKERTPEEHIEDRMADEAVAWIEKYHDKSFFLNYWMFSVHAPFDAKKENIARHAGRIDSDDLQRCPTYAAMIQSMDDAIGTLLDGLDRLKITDNTIIVFSSDNGGNMYSDVDGVVPTSNRPLRGGKATVFEGGTRVPGVIVWPGITSPDSRSDVLIQSEDYYPTLLEGLGLPTGPEQSFDGISILPALRGEPVNRDAIFQYFPHNPPVPDWLSPSVSVHRGDWKLIRVFHGGENGAHRHLLFNLKEDIGEKQNLVSQHPELVAELDSRIEGFLKKTNAVVPVLNPAFDPSQYHPEREGQAGRKEQSNKRSESGTKPGASKEKENPALQGWKARNCRAEANEGIVTIEGLGREPFLGFAAGKLDNQATLKFRIRTSGGQGKVAWISGVNANPIDGLSPALFSTKPGEWAEIETTIPAVGDLSGILRLFVPAQDQPVELDWIELDSAGKTRRWDF